MLVSSAEVDQAATQQYAKTIAAAQQKGLLDRDPATVQRVRTIANRLIVQTGAFRKDAPGWKWEVHVITSDQLNAWCMPGGKMAVYTGLIEKLKLSDDEIAAVMGHEIAHALREHGRERVSQQMATGHRGRHRRGCRSGSGRAARSSPSMVAEVTFTLPNSRAARAARPTGSASSSPRAPATTRGPRSRSGRRWRRPDGGSPPQFLSTHPSPENRIKDLEVYAAKVMPLYEAAARKRG